MEITELMIKDNYDPNEEFYAYETKDPNYIEFLKRTGQYTEEKKELENENSRTKKNNQKVQNRNKKIYQ